MSSPFQNIINVGLEIRRSMAGQTATYNDGTSSGSITVVRGRPFVRAVDALVTQLEERYTDFMVAVDDLDAITGAKPMPGDTITLDGDTYEVTYFQGTPPWSYVDTAETEYRIHTIKTGDV